MKKSLAVSVVLVLALAAMGVGYALWSQNLTATGTVWTGKMDIQFTDVQFTADSEWVSVDKGLTDGNHTAWFYAEKVYPGCTFDLVLTAQNKGTMPCKYDTLVDLSITGPDGNDLSFGDVYKLVLPQTIDIPPASTILEPGESDTITIRLTVNPKLDETELPELAKYEGTITLKFVQTTP